MASVTRIEPETRKQAAARAALEQMFGYYAFDWQPFAPAKVKQAA